MVGSFISWAGDWMDLATLNWAVLQFTDSALALGVINACRLVPVFALSFPAGVLADRFDRRRLLLVLQSGMMVLTFAIGWLVYVEAPFWLFAVMVTARSTMSAMSLPVRTAMLPDLVTRDALASAVASQSLMMNIARSAGLAIAAGLLVVLPLHALFWINGASFVLVLATLLIVRPLQVSPRRAATRGGAVGEAVGYIRTSPSVQSLLVLAIVPMVFGFPYQTLMPLFARDLYGLDEGGYGLLLTLAAVGALTGALWLSFRGSGRHAGRWLVLSVLGFGGGLVLLASAGGFWFAAAMAFLVGFVSQIYRTMSRITIQLQVPEHLRGRILAIALMDRGFMPLGTLLLGAVAEWGGTRVAGWVMGVGCIAVTLGVLAIRGSVWHLDLSKSEPVHPRT